MSQELAPLPADVEPIKRQADYSEATIDLALLTYAETGSSNKAEKQLAHTGTHVPAGTIRQWRRDYPMRYAAVVARHRPELDRMLAAKFRDGVVAELGVQSRLVGLIEDQIKAGDVKDPSQVLQRVSVSTGIKTDKLGALEGRPTVHEHRNIDFADIKQELAQRVPGLFAQPTEVTEGTLSPEVDADNAHE